MRNLLYHLFRQTAIGRRAMRDWPFAYRFARWGILESEEATKAHQDWWERKIEGYKLKDGKVLN